MKERKIEILIVDDKFQDRKNTKFCFFPKNHFAKKDEALIFLEDTFKFVEENIPSKAISNLKKEIYKPDIVIIDIDFTDNKNIEGIKESDSSEIAGYQLVEYLNEIEGEIPFFVLSNQIGVKDEVTILLNKLMSQKVSVFTKMGILTEPHFKNELKVVMKSIAKEKFKKVIESNIETLHINLNSLEREVFLKNYIVTNEETRYKLSNILIGYYNEMENSYEDFKTIILNLLNLTKKNEYKGVFKPNSKNTIYPYLKKYLSLSNRKLIEVINTISINLFLDSYFKLIDEEGNLIVDGVGGLKRLGMDIDLKNNLEDFDSTISANIENANSKDLKLFLSRMIARRVLFLWEKKFTGKFKLNDSIFYFLKFKNKDNHDFTSTTRRRFRNKLGISTKGERIIIEGNAYNEEIDFLNSYPINIVERLISFIKNINKSNYVIELKNSYGEKSITNMFYLQKLYSTRSFVVASKKKKFQEEIKDTFYEIMKTDYVVKKNKFENFYLDELLESIFK